MQVLPSAIHRRVLRFFHKPRHDSCLGLLFLLLWTHSQRGRLLWMRQRQKGGEQRERVRLRKVIARERLRQLVELGLRGVLRSKLQKPLEMVENRRISAVLM